MFSKISWKVAPLLIPMDASLKTAFRVLSSLLSERIFNASKEEDLFLSLKIIVLLQQLMSLSKRLKSSLFILFFFDFKLSNFLFFLFFFLSKDLFKASFLSTFDTVEFSFLILLLFDSLLF